MKAEVNAERLRVALEGCQHYADTNPRTMIPSIAAVRVRASVGTVYVDATDRFVMASATWENVDDYAPDGADQFEALIPVRDIKAIIATLKTVKRYAKAPATLTVEGAMLTVSVYESATSCRLQDGDLPNLDRLMDGYRDREPGPVDAIAVDPAKLAKLGKLPVGNTVVLRFGGPNMPMFAETDDDAGITWRVAIMPRRIPS